MNRRALLQGLMGVGAGLILPPSLAQNAEATRHITSFTHDTVPPWIVEENGGVVHRYWALDQGMLRSPSSSFSGDRALFEAIWDYIVRGPSPTGGFWVEAVPRPRTIGWPPHHRYHGNAATDRDSHVVSVDEFANVYTRLERG